MTEANQLPPYVSIEVISERLPLIFPEGTPNRNYCIRDLAASTIFAMIYIGAIEGTNRYLAPKHVYRMTDLQAGLNTIEDRLLYSKNAIKPGSVIQGKQWYADTTREPIRDETLRNGLIPLGVAGANESLATTSSKPRYFLYSHFVHLFDPNLKDEPLMKAINEWQEKYLSKSALTRISLGKITNTATENKILVTFPNGETRSLTQGPSSDITKAVIEEFAKRFLQNPIVLWISESGNKVADRDNKIASSIGLKIDAATNLVDIILVDVAPPDPLLVFIEVVATDGPVNQLRQDALFKITDAAEFKRSQVAFVSAYKDRESPGAKKTMHSLAWNSFAWFYTEPDNIIILRSGKSKKLFLNTLNEELQ
jgi:hypothetical protein